MFRNTLFDYLIHPSQYYTHLYTIINVVYNIVYDACTHYHLLYII